MSISALEININGNISIVINISSHQRQPPIERRRRATQTAKSLITLPRKSKQRLWKISRSPWSSKSAAKSDFAAKNQEAARAPSGAPARLARPHLHLADLTYPSSISILSSTSAAISDPRAQRRTCTCALPQATIIYYKIAIIIIAVIILLTKQ